MRRPLVLVAVLTVALAASCSSDSGRQLSTRSDGGEAGLEETTTTLAGDPGTTAVPGEVTSTTEVGGSPSSTVAPVTTTTEPGGPTPTVTSTTVSVDPPTSVTTVPKKDPPVTAPATTVAAVANTPGLVVTYPARHQMDNRMLDAIPAALDYGQITDSFALNSTAVPTPLLAAANGKTFSVRSTRNTGEAQDAFDQLAGEKGEPVAITLQTTNAPGSALLAQLVKAQLEQFKNMRPVTVVAA